MPTLEPCVAEEGCEKTRLARNILDAAQRAEDLGIAEAALLLRMAQAIAERAAEAGRAGLVN